MKLKSLLCAFFTLATLVFWSCEKDRFQTKENRQPTLPTKAFDYSIEKATSLQVSSHWGGSSTPNLLNDDNPQTNEGATLGRVLFYDGRLSVNDLISCGSCHRQAFGFADPSPFSLGVGEERTTRNSMAIANMGLVPSYFWDRRASDLEEQVMMPIENHVEMGIEKLEDLPGKLASVEYYGPLFEAAFGDAEITEQRISYALAQFLRGMVSLDSKFDKGIENGFSNFTTLEIMGMELFLGRAKCASCHEFPLVGGRGAANIGLDEIYLDNGWRRGKFKIPSLRNIARTAPYMHDGRFENLREVLDHYSEGIQSHHSLDWRLRGPALNLSDIEKDALMAFLNTLTDEAYLTDPKFSDPF